MSNDYQALEPKNLLATFTGTDGDDIVIVRFVDDVPTEVEINGVVGTNPHLRAHLALGAGNDSIFFENVEVDGLIEPGVNNNIIRGTVNERLTFVHRFGAVSYTHLTLPTIYSV